MILLFAFLIRLAPRNDLFSDKLVMSVELLSQIGQLHDDDI